MGFSLANFGLMADGANAVLNERTARMNAEEDRQYQLARRRREEEEAIAKQEEERRTRAYAEELRATLPKYLAGGERGIAAKPAIEGQTFDARQAEGGDVPIAAQPAKPATDNTEGLYEALKGIAAKHGRLDHYEAMKDRVKKASEEGVIDFIKKARQGAPESELIETFNKSGKVKISGLRKMGDDEYAGVTPDGERVRLNLTSLTESLLAPKDLLAHQDRGDKTAAALEAKRLQLEGRDRENAARAGEREARARAAEVTAEAARIRAEAAKARADGAGAPKPRGAGNWNQFDSQVKALAREQLTSRDPDSGKAVIDHKNVASLTSMASAIARRDPDLSPGEAISAAMEKLDEIRGVQDKSQDQAEQETAGLTFGSPKDREKWIANRAKNLVRARTAPAEASTAPAPVRAPKATVAGPKVGAEVDGYRFKGGNPNDPANWEKI